MVANINAIEVNGEIDSDGQLRLDESLPIVGPSRVRVIVLIDSSADLPEDEWLQAVARGPDFEFLKDPAEDIYTMSDGKPFND